MIDGQTRALADDQWIHATELDGVAVDGWIAIKHVGKSAAVVSSLPPKNLLITFGVELDGDQPPPDLLEINHKTTPWLIFKTTISRGKATTQEQVNGQGRILSFHSISYRVMMFPYHLWVKARLITLNRSESMFCPIVRLFRRYIKDK